MGWQERKGLLWLCSAVGLLGFGALPRYHHRRACTSLSRSLSFFLSPSLSLPPPLSLPLLPSLSLLRGHRRRAHTTTNTPKHSALLPAVVALCTFPRPAVCARVRVCPAPALPI